jgi:hypothetical protein
MTIGPGLVLAKAFTEEVQQLAVESQAEANPFTPEEREEARQVAACLLKSVEVLSYERSANLWRRVYGALTSTPPR